LGALARSAWGEGAEFLWKTAKNILEMEDFLSAGAAQKARFWRNRGLMNGLPAERAPHVHAVLWGWGARRR
jgi:hypothetical protein